AREKVSRIAKFTHDAGRVEVDFAAQQHRRVSEAQLCEITVHLKKHFVKAHASAPEAEAALDLAVDKIGHQVARIKEKRVSRSHPRRRNGHAGASNGAVVDLDEGELEDDDGAEAQIVKTKRFTAKPMQPGEAALQLQLLGHDFYLFTNSETGRAAVLYRRHDGDLGLIETTG
ncbi:MAG TPA: ribosome-associated translation inhibitor RaiA, partial [Acidimicrobiia bacterium]|nr:ribosome-associated translation inhibitor RaiA [Acidimicrobiia bacterium]